MDHFACLYPNFCVRQSSKLGTLLTVDGSTPPSKIQLQGLINDFDGFYVGHCVGTHFSANSDPHPVVVSLACNGVVSKPKQRKAAETEVASFVVPCFNLIRLVFVAPLRIQILRRSTHDVGLYVNHLRRRLRLLFVTAFLVDTCTVQTSINIVGAVPNIALRRE